VSRSKASTSKASTLETNALELGAPKHLKRVPCRLLFVLLQHKEEGDGNDTVVTFFFLFVYKATPFFFLFLDTTFFVGAKRK